jgi:hypothetical protein
MSFTVKNLEIDLYDYYPTTFLFRYVNYQVTTEYINSNKYNIIVRRIDIQQGWKDNLKVLVYNNSTNDTEIVNIPNSYSTNEQIVEMNTTEPIYPSNEQSVRLPVINLPSIESIYKISRTKFNEIFTNANIRVLPSSLYAVGIKNSKIYMYNMDYSRYSNICEPILHILKVALKYKYDNFYFVISSCDGYIEGTYNEKNRFYLKEITEEDIEDGQHLYYPKKETEIPVFHNNVYILAQSTHVDLPFTINIVDRHYFYHNLYHSFSSFHMGIPFYQKQNKLVFAAQNRDTKYNFATRKDIDLPPRQYFRDVIAPKYPDFIVCGGWIERTEMAQNYKYIMEIDGRASTYDATFWKMNSGSVIFKSKSIWKQWFYDDFKAGVHFIELNEDFSDIEEKYIWCENHPNECMEMIQQCKELSKKIYTYSNVIEYTRTVVEKLCNM